MAIGRVICGEILDHLPADDPSALRGRLDLLAINALMGNIRWVRRALRRAMKGKENECAWRGCDTLCRNRRGRRTFVPEGCALVSRCDSDRFGSAPRPAELPRAIFGGRETCLKNFPAVQGRHSSAL